MIDPRDLPDQPPVSDPAPDERTFSGKLRAPGPDPVRLGILVGVALVIVIGAGLTMGASSAPSALSVGAALQPEASSAPGSSGAPGGQGGPGFGGPGRRFGPNAGGFGGPGFGGLAPFGQWSGGPRLGHRGERGGFGFGRITITAIDGSNLSLKTDDGWTRTISVSSATTITKGGQKASLGDLKVGDEVRFSETRNSDGTFTIGELDVVLPHVVGTVSAVTGDGFTLTTPDGTSWTISVTSSTTYRVGPTNGSKSDVTVGATVAAEGTQGSGNSLTATSVRVEPARVIGQVTAKTATTITVQRRDGTTATIHVAGATTYRVLGAANGSLSDITVGMFVAAEGTQRSDGSLDATAVLAGNPGQRFHGGPAAPNPSASPGSQG